MKICKIEGCGRKHYAKGYCDNHYHVIIWNPTHRKNISLSHQKYYLKTKILKRLKCNVKECGVKTAHKSGLCSFHLRRKVVGLPLDNKKYSAKGERNGMWKGGIAKYPNHYLMKKQRLIILMNNPKCEYCGKPATQIHHKDENKANHKLSNLAATCRSCNLKQSSRLYKKFGYTLREITERLSYTERSSSYWFNHQEKINHLIS